MDNYHALALFSGGLDSILAVKVVQKQGLNVLGLHFVSPFFGHPDKVAHWQKLYSIPIKVIDVSEEYVRMLKEGPKFGRGKVLNPCIDCKIFMLKKARDLLSRFGAKFIITGEVVGQRPMSQRRDALYLIRREAEVKDVLLRPLSARLLEPTPMEESGLVNRDQLPGISGRGRKEQLKLAREFKLHEIPSPAGGCLLTEKESARRYLPLLQKGEDIEAADFYLANVGRQYWSGNSLHRFRYWLSIGRNKDDNEHLLSLAKETDYLFKLKDFPGPIGLGRPFKVQSSMFSVQCSGNELPQGLRDREDWPEEIILSAASLICGFSPKARRSKRQIEVEVSRYKRKWSVLVLPATGFSVDWQQPVWDKEDWAE